MIPLLDDNKSLKRIGIATSAIIVLNVIMFLIFPDRTIPVNISSVTNLQSFTLFTLAGIISLFLHANILHIGFNMLYLYVFGTPLENKIGKFKFLLIYFISGIAGFYLYYLTAATNLPVIGASGAISGVIAAYLVLLPKSKILSLWPILWIIRLIYIPAWIFIGFWIVSQLISLTLLQGDGIAYQSHIGGIIIGLIIGLIYLKASRKNLILA